MKKTLIALATLGILSSAAYAQSSVTIYGVVEEAVRFTTNSDTAHHSQTQLNEGLLQGSRLGFKGSEELGSGLKAIFTLESGFNISNGMIPQNRLFGREATVGLDSKQFGKLTMGRQTTLGTDFSAMTDVYRFANNNVFVGYQGALTGLRFDNSLKYTNSFGPISLGGQYAFGNQTGEQSTNSAYSLTVGYTEGPLDVRAVYQHTHDTNEGVPGTKPGQNLNLSAIGGSYNFGSTQLFGQYYHAQFDISNQHNNIIVVSANHNLTPSLSMKGSYAHDVQTNFNPGKRNSITGLLDYSFSRRTDIYTAVDYTKLDGQYNNVVYNLNNKANSNTSSVGVTVGVRHRF